MIRLLRFVRRFGGVADQLNAQKVAEISRVNDRWINSTYTPRLLVQKLKQAQSASEAKVELISFLRGFPISRSQVPAARIQNEAFYASYHLLTSMNAAGEVPLDINVKVLDYMVDSKRLDDAKSLALQLAELELVGDSVKSIANALSLTGAVDELDVLFERTMEKENIRALAMFIEPYGNIGDYSTIEEILGFVRKFAASHENEAVLQLYRESLVSSMKAFSLHWTNLDSVQDLLEEFDAVSDEANDRLYELSRQHLLRCIRRQFEHICPTIRQLPAPPAKTKTLERKIRNSKGLARIILYEKLKKKQKQHSALFPEQAIDMRKACADLMSLAHSQFLDVLQRVSLVSAETLNSYLACVDKSQAIEFADARVRDAQDALRRYIVNGGLPDLHMLTSLISIVSRSPTDNIDIDSKFDLIWHYTNMIRRYGYVKSADTYESMFRACYSSQEPFSEKARKELNRWMLEMKNDAIMHSEASLFSLVDVLTLKQDSSKAYTAIKHVLSLNEKFPIERTLDIFLKRAMASKDEDVRKDAENFRRRLSASW